MSQDFVTTLERQLSEAERREEHGGLLARVLATARTMAPSRAVAAGLAAGVAAIIAVVIGAAVLTRGGNDDTVAGPGPRVVARLSTGPIFDMAPGFGSLWINSSDLGAVLRVDPGASRIVARIPVGRLPSGVAPAAGAMWVISDSVGSASSTLSRVDPATNRVTTRVRLTGTPRALIQSEGVLTLLSSGDALWVLGGPGGVRLDPRTAAVAKLARWGLGGGAFADAFALSGNDLWVHGGDGRLLRLDARTGALRATLSSPPGPATLAAVPGPAVVVAASDGTITRIDGRTGRTQWTARFASASSETHFNRAVQVAGDSVWVLRQHNFRVTDRLTRIDLASGRIRGSTPLKEFDADWLTAVGGELWYAAGPQTMALKP